MVGNDYCSVINRLDRRDSVLCRLTRMASTLEDMKAQGDIRLRNLWLSEAAR